MKNIEREKIKIDYIENVYKKSWTFAKLTENEKSKILDILYTLKVYANSADDIAYELHFIYYTFLVALDYKPIGWREENDGNLLF